MATAVFPELGHVLVWGQTLLYSPVLDAAHLYGLLAASDRSACA
ncbi:hypothetical protein [Streptomyces galbus]|nr:hypothetical protein [Streptomyces galbus]